MTRFNGLEGLTILGMGRALPGAALDNAAVLAAAGAPPGVSAEALAIQMGVSARHWTHAVGTAACHDEPTSLDLAIEAGRLALADAGLAPADLDGLIVVTTTAPRPSVNTGNHVAKALGITGCSLEVKAGCAGGVYGLVTAAGYHALGARRLLLVAAESWSKLIPRAFPGPMAVAGDGAAALVLGPGAGALLGAATEIVPAHAGAMMPPGLYPPTEAALARGDYALRVEGDVAEQVRDLYPAVFEAALAAAGLGRDDVDLFIPHQASGPILRRALRDCGIAPERAYHTLARYGNASSASVLLSLHDARAEGLLRPGMRVALTAVGGGIAAASAILRVA